MRTLSLALSALVLFGCSSARPGPTDTGRSQAKTDFLQSVSDCTAGRYQTFAEQSALLRNAVAAFLANPNPDNLAQARAAFLSAMPAWQEAELFSVGPAAPSSTPGGEGLRDQIDAFPLVGRCFTEQQLVSQAYTKPDFDSSLVTGRGFPALEYLLFYPGSDNSCSSSSAINSQGTWAALSSEELANRKRAYALAVAEDILKRANDLNTSWANTFSSKLSAAGPGNSVWSSQQSALNGLSDSVFFLEGIVKDRKLGKPLGLFECPNERCPESLEALYSEDNRARIEANMKGAQKILFGCSAESDPGFDDLLIAQGNDDLVNRLKLALQAADAAIDATPEAGWAADLSNNPAPLKDAYDKLKAVTDLLKSEFVTVLDLELPKQFETDND